MMNRGRESKVQAVPRLSEDSAVREFMIKNAREKVRNFFSEDRIPA
jgi:hypothetical protein